MSDLFRRVPAGPGMPPGARRPPHPGEGEGQAAQTLAHRGHTALDALEGAKGLSALGRGREVAGALEGAGVAEGLARWPQLGRGLEAAGLHLGVAGAALGPLIAAWDLREAA